MHFLRRALAMMVLLLAALACGMDGDERMVRKYAECMADPNTALHRLTVSGAVGTVGLSAEATEERLHVQLERGEVTVVVQDAQQVVRIVAGAGRWDGRWLETPFDKGLGLGFVQVVETLDDAGFDGPVAVERR